MKTGLGYLTALFLTLPLLGAQCANEGSAGGSGAAATDTSGNAAAATTTTASATTESATAVSNTTGAATADQPSPGLDAGSMAALAKMGAYLRSLKAFQVAAATSLDQVMDNGQIITMDSQIDLLVRTPDRSRVEITSPLQHRLYLYNGKDFTVYGEVLNYYATVPAPPTLARLAADLDEKYGVQVPLEDLFFWGTPQSKEKDITSASDLGQSQVDGVSCEHYAFRQPGLDWQVWMQLGDFPLPRKLILTTLTDDARPQYRSTLDWNLAPSFSEATFDFTPPSGAHKINLVAANATPNATN